MGKFLESGQLEDLEDERIIRWKQVVRMEEDGARSGSWPMVGSGINVTGSYGPIDRVIQSHI